jgi:LmbE family N-acetylglucosaminyl deacetylase
VQRSLRNLLAVVIVLAVATSGTRSIAQVGPVVILAPHPDDETLGCGGLIARRISEGRRVVVVVITDGRALLRRFGIAANPSEAEVSAMRKDETRRSVEILGGNASEIRFLDFENERLVAQKADALARITALLKELAPGEVYFPSPFEGHAEHVVTNEIARAACAATGACPATFEFIINLKRGTSIESLPRRLQPVDVSAHRDRERRALAQFRSHLDILYSGQKEPLAANYDHYLTSEEPFLVEPR